MKYVILFLLLFQLVGCSSNEEKKYIKLSLTELEVGKEGVESFVEITANCKWIAQNDNKNVTLSIQQGEGNAKLSFKVSANDEYDQQNYTITVNSVDNFSAATLKIHQKEKKGFILENTSNNFKEIPAEGGAFTIIANTNIEDIEIQKPDWISTTFPNSRVLEKKQFHFVIMENTEGHERSGTIRIGKNEMASDIYVKQEPYLPESFSVSDFKNVSFNIGKSTYNTFVEPSYADLSRLSVTSSDESVCIPSLERDKLVLDFKKYGSANIRVRSGDKLLFMEDVENLSPNFGFNREYNGEYAIGYEFNIEMTHPMKYFSFKSSNENVAKIINENHVLVTGKGEATITARFDLIDKVVSFKVIGRDVEVSSISLIPKEKQLKAGESFNLSYVIFPENSTDKTVNWKSENENIASVKDGKVVAIASGETYIKVTASSGISDKCKVNVSPNNLKWFAGVCNAIPITSAQVRALKTSGLYTGTGSYKVQVENWKMMAFCIPYGDIKEIKLSYPGNFIEDSGVCSGPFEISVEGANGSEATIYKMWIIKSEGINDPDTFTFKTQ